MALLQRESEASFAVWLFGVVVASFVARTRLLDVESVSTGMVIVFRWVCHLGICNQPPTRSIHPYIPLGSLNQIPVLIDRVGVGISPLPGGRQHTCTQPFYGPLGFCPGLPR